MRNLFASVCLVLSAPIAAHAQSLSEAPYADINGVYNVTATALAKACKVSVNDVHDILQYMASSEAVTYKWVPVCDSKAWWNLQDKYRRLHSLHEVSNFPNEGQRYFVDTTNIVRDPKDGIVFVNATAPRDRQVVEAAITEETLDFNRHPQPASGPVQLAKSH